MSHHEHVNYMEIEAKKDKSSAVDTGMFSLEKIMKESAKQAAEKAFENGIIVLTYNDIGDLVGLAVEQFGGQLTDEEKAKFQINPDLYHQKFLELAQLELDMLYKIEAKWHELEKAREDLISGEAVKNIGHEYFKAEKECACCMDERVGNRETLGGEEVGRRWNVAGSGILLPEKSWKERTKLAAKEAFERGVTILTFHDGCGAAGLAVKQDLDQFSDEEKAVYTANTDIYGQKFVELAQEELNKLHKKAEKPLHVTKQEVLPFEYHAAIGATVDATGEFNTYQLPAEHPLKYTFNIDTSSGETVQGEKATYYMNELVVAIRIATGHHGFGHKFNKDNQFAIVLIAETQDEIEARKAEITEFIKKNEPNAVELVKFVEFVKPEAKKHRKQVGGQTEIEAQL